ncbi:MAG: hypothetical protein NC311_08710 [Muribaculaceae bacterium]|nr:hypothetical protein [Muribaculaceae bacterium]MCM1399868.1 hypothetical protein [Clostridium sp.]MCM1460647.1 hypothetical protein [Bacteroides sp.]
MADKKPEALSADEQKSVLEAVCTAMKAHATEVKVNFESFEKTAACISVFSETGAMYISKDILGGFRGLVPFYIVYRGYPKNDKQRFAIIKYLEELSNWICKKENYPMLGDGREIEDIKAMSVPSLNQISDSGSYDYVVPYQIIYRKGDD